MPGELCSLEALDLELPLYCEEEQEEEKLRAPAEAGAAPPRELHGFRRRQKKAGPPPVDARAWQAAYPPACSVPLDASGFCVSKGASGRKLDMAYEFVNWFLSGWAGAYLNRQGYYSAVLSTAKASMAPYEWDYWMEGKPAAQDIKGPDGGLLEKAGSVRDGGSYNDRMGAVACWNAVMDENDYMVRKWNEFIAA